MNVDIACRWLATGYSCCSAGYENNSNCHRDESGFPSPPVTWKSGATRWKRHRGHQFTRELGGKRVELLKEIAPELFRVEILWNADALDIGWGTGFKEYEAKAKALKIPLDRCLYALQISISTVHFALPPKRA